MTWRRGHPLTLFAVPLRRRSLLHARRGPDTAFLPLLLPTRIPNTEHLWDCLCPNRSVDWLWDIEHLRHDFPMYTGFLLLESVDRRILGNLHQDLQVFMVQGCHADCHGSLYYEHSHSTSNGPVFDKGEEGADLPHVLRGFPVRITIPSIPSIANTSLGLP